MIETRVLTLHEKLGVEYTANISSGAHRHADSSKLKREKKLCKKCKYQQGGDEKKKKIECVTDFPQRRV